MLASNTDSRAVTLDLEPLPLLGLSFLLFVLRVWEQVILESLPEPTAHSLATLSPVHGPAAQAFPWELVRNAGSQAQPRPAESEPAF